MISGAATASRRCARRFDAAGVRCHAADGLARVPLAAAGADARRRSNARPRARAVSRRRSCAWSRTSPAASPRRRAHARRVLAPARARAGALRRRRRGAARAEAATCFVEIGPHPDAARLRGATLGDDAPDCGGHRCARAATTGREMLEALAALYRAGVAVDWRGVDAGVRAAHRRRADLPVPARAVLVPGAPRRGRRRPPRRAPAIRCSAAPAQRRRARRCSSRRCRADAPAFVRQHRVQGTSCCRPRPTSSTLLAAARSCSAQRCRRRRRDDARGAVLAATDGAPRVACSSLHAGPRRRRGVAVAISSARAAATAPWIDHLTRHLAARPRSPRRSGASLDAAARARCTEPVATDDVLRRASRDLGLDFGAGVPVAAAAWRGGAARRWARWRSSRAARPRRRALRHASGAARRLPAGAVGGASADEPTTPLYLPVGIGRLRAAPAPARTRCLSHVRLRAGGGTRRGAPTCASTTSDGTLLAEIDDVQLQPVAAGALARLGDAGSTTALHECGVAQRAAERATPGARRQRRWPRSADRAVAGHRQAAQLDALRRLPAAARCLCADHVVRALQRLGWSPRARRARARRRRSRPPRRVPARHRACSRGCSTILAEERPADARGRRVRGARPWPAPAIREPDTSTRLRAPCPGGAAPSSSSPRAWRASWPRRCAASATPPQLLFPGGSLETAERLYRDSPTARFYNGLVAERAGRGGDRPRARPLRDPRTRRRHRRHHGARAAAAAAPGVEYTFTDIGPLFVARARERFAAHAVHALRHARPRARSAGAGLRRRQLRRRRSPPT